MHPSPVARSALWPCGRGGKHVGWDLRVRPGLAGSRNGDLYGASQQAERRGVLRDSVVSHGWWPAQRGAAPARAAKGRARRRVSTERSRGACRGPTRRAVPRMQRHLEPSPTSARRLASRTHSASHEAARLSAAHLHPRPSSAHPCAPSRTAPPRRSRARRVCPPRPLHLAAPRPRRARLAPLGQHGGHLHGARDAAHALHRRPVAQQLRRTQPAKHQRECAGEKRGQTACSMPRAL
jgi:hypothetical protein